MNGVIIKRFHDEAFHDRYEFGFEIRDEITKLVIEVEYESVKRIVIYREGDLDSDFCFKFGRERTFIKFLLHSSSCDIAIVDLDCRYKS